MKKALSFFFFIVLAIVLPPTGFSQEPTTPINIYYQYYTDKVTIEGLDLVFTLGGDYTYQYHKKHIHTGSDVNTRTMNTSYMGGQTSIRLMFCTASYCGGVEQNIGGLYPYSGASSRFYGSTWVLFGFRSIIGRRSVISIDLGSGLLSDNGKNNINTSLYGNNNIMFGLKIDAEWTIFFHPDFGIGFHLSPSFFFPIRVHKHFQNLSYYIFSLSPGIHISAKY